MKRIYVLLTVTLIFVILICGCMGFGGLSAGTYYNTRDTYSRISLGVDGTFINDGRNETTDGTYTSDGTVLTAHGNCQTGKGTVYFKRSCGDPLTFDSYYKISSDKTFCQMTGKDGSVTSVCYTLKSS
jgi:hypothetical protein